MNCAVGSLVLSSVQTWYRQWPKPHLLPGGYSSDSPQLCVHVLQLIKITDGVKSRDQIPCRFNIDMAIIIDNSWGLKRGSILWFGGFLICSSHLSPRISHAAQFNSGSTQKHKAADAKCNHVSFWCKYSVLNPHDVSEWNCASSGGALKSCMLLWADKYLLTLAITGHIQTSR